MPSTHPTRRRALAAAGALGAALLGGCSGSLPASTGSAPETTLAFQMHALDGPLHERHVVDLDDTRPSWDERAFRAALNGSEFTTQHRPPFPTSDADDPAYVRHEGTYYRLGSVVVGEHAATHPVLRLESVGRLDTLDDPPAHVVAENLPDADRTAVRAAYMAARARGNRGGVPWRLVQRGGYVFRSDDARAESSLLGDDAPTHVAYRDALYRIEVTTERFHEAVYRPEVEPVADTDDALEAVLRARLLDARLDRADLSDAERSVVREARNGGYEATHPFPESARSLLRKLDHRAYIDGNVSKDAGVETGTWRLLLYDGSYYRYLLDLRTE